MLQLIQTSGLVGFVLLAIAGYCLVLIGKALLRGTPEEVLQARRSLLFWGVLATLVGFVGHTIGIYTALGVILEQEDVQAVHVSEALRTSLGPVLIGFAALAIAGTGWFGLGLRERTTRSA